MALYYNVNADHLAWVYNSIRYLLLLFVDLDSQTAKLKELING